MRVSTDKTNCSLAYAYGYDSYSLIVIAIGSNRLSIDIVCMRWCDVNEQIPIEMLAERSADKVESHRVGAAVGERHAEADDAQHMPEHVVILFCSGPAGEW